ncbi:hypothetical protein N0V90_006429 [Kalmusia sp. IMI 367209]|nr:hypothetical protein N0V90_006429 [Kalmusia sp. IMI 367209]
MDFNYPKLDEDDLRLLRPLTIQPDLLSFAMRSFPRTDTPPYTAVSYTWGEDAPTDLIYINAQPFHVRRNLWSCLYYMGQDSEAPLTHLWVDAICIDQTNDQERSAQVRAMGTIYRSAFCVSVWLGLPPWPAWHAQPRKPVKMLDIDRFDWWNAIQELANRPYWRRVWVIQEFLLARDVNLYCGSNRMNFMYFNDLLGHQTEGASYLEPGFDYARHESGSWAAWPLIVGRHTTLYPHMQQSLYELLISHSNAQCKDPRDKVFALLGLVKPSERDSLGRSFPDYTLGEDDVVIIALSHIRQFDLEYDGHDDERLFLGLGVDCEERRKRLAKRARDYDSRGGLRPSIFFESDEVETDNEGTDIFRRGSRSREEAPRYPWFKWVLPTLVIMSSLRFIQKVYFPKKKDNTINNTVSSQEWTVHNSPPQP